MSKVITPESHPNLRASLDEFLAKSIKPIIYENSGKFGQTAQYLEQLATESVSFHNMACYVRNALSSEFGENEISECKIGFNMQDFEVYEAFESKYIVAAVFRDGSYGYFVKEDGPNQVIKLEKATPEQAIEFFKAAIYNN